MPQSVKAKRTLVVDRHPLLAVYFLHDGRKHARTSCSGTKVVLDDHPLQTWLLAMQPKRREDPIAVLCIRALLLPLLHKFLRGFHALEQRLCFPWFSACRMHRPPMNGGHGFAD